MKCIDIFPAVSADKSSFLDKATELDLATRWKRGDVEARNKIIVAHQPLAHRIARAYAATYGLDADDLLGEAQIGLLRAADKFDPSLGNRFSTYAQHWIDAKVRATCAKPAAGMTPGRSKTARPALFRLDAPVAPDDPENDQTGHDVTADPNGVTAGDIIEALDVDKARAAIRTIKLSDRNRRIVEARLADQPVAEIAAEHGLTPQRIDQIWSDFFARAVKAKGKAEPATWFEWSDRPPAELPRNITHLEQAAPEWWRSMQRCWPPDRASFRTERRVEVVPGPARMPLVQSRWGYAHWSPSTGLQRRKVKGRLRIFGPTVPAERRVVENKKPRPLVPARHHLANRALLISLGVDGTVPLHDAVKRQTARLVVPNDNVVLLVTRRRVAA